MSRDDPPLVETDDPRPHAPREPAREECCQKGCEPCVFDRYFEALEHYEAALRAWLERHPEAGTVSPLGRDKDST